MRYCGNRLPAAGGNADYRLEGADVEKAHSPWRMASDLTISLSWYGLLALVNQTTSQPVISILPYIIPVAYLGWKYNLFWAFTFAAVAAVSAVPAGFGAKHPGAIYWAGLTTYAKLSCTAAVLRIVKEATRGGAN